MAASATFALKAGVWFRRGRLFIVSPDSRGTACPLSGRNSTYRPVQILEAGSERLASFCATGQTSGDGSDQGIIIDWTSGDGSSHDAFPTETIFPTETVHPMESVHAFYDLVV
jgi:hypothetical protein